MIDLFKDYWEHFEDAAKDRALNVSDFAKKHNVYGAELWISLTPKLLSEQKFRSERLNLSGIIDVLEIHDVNGEKSYVPLELKTGKCPDKGMWDGHRIQLAAYLLLLEDSGKKTGEAVIKYQGAEKRLLHMNPFLRSEVLELIQKTDSVLKDLVLPEYTDNKNKCKNCHFKEKCYDPETMQALLIGASERLKITTNSF
jgi:CRISPR-associated exonuclease Cas4